MANSDPKVQAPESVPATLQQQLPPNAAAGLRFDPRVKQPTKNYRLKYGTHSVPDPDANPERDGAQTHHRLFTVGDVIPLTQKQYDAFSDKFEGPLSDSAGTPDIKSDAAA